MADGHQLNTLRLGFDAWNTWRDQNPDVIPDLHRADLTSVDLSGCNLVGADLSDANLADAMLLKTNLRRANLHRAIFGERALLHGALLREVRLTDVDLDQVMLEGVDLIGADLSRSRMRGSDLSKANLLFARMCGTDLRGARLNSADLRSADLHNADLRGASLQRVNLVRTNLAGANLSGCYVYGVSTWDVDLTGTEQSNLIITDHGAQTITVDDLEVAQFIYLLMNRSKLRNVLNTMGEKAVLILGRFTERQGLLDRIAQQLRALDYLPIIFDFERPTDRDLTETVKILAGLSRFVIADITNAKSVPLELQAIVPDYMVPFVTIAERNQPTFSMFDDLPKKYSWAVPLLLYESADTLMASFERKVVEPALEKLQEVRRQRLLAPTRRSAED